MRESNTPVIMRNHLALTIVALTASDVFYFTRQSPREVCLLTPYYDYS